MHGKGNYFKIVIRITYREEVMSMDQKNVMWAVGALIVGIVVGYILKGPNQPQDLQQSTTSPTSTVIEASKPSEGFTLHIDAEKHFPGDTNKIAHHFCKQVSGGIYECQLYELDEKDARLVGVEVVIPTDMWKTFSTSEKKLWHYHKEEIPKVNAKLPELSEEEAAKVVNTLEETYGKIYLLWDPAVNNQPVGNPKISVL